MGYSLRKSLGGVLSLSNGHVFDTVLPKLFGWRGLAGKKKARKLGLKTTPTYEIGWQTAYYKTAALPLS